MARFAEEGAPYVPPEELADAEGTDRLRSPRLEEAMQHTPTAHLVYLLRHLPCGHFANDLVPFL